MCRRRARRCAQPHKIDLHLAHPYFLLPRHCASPRHPRSVWKQAGGTGKQHARIHATLLSKLHSVLGRRPSRKQQLNRAVQPWDERRAGWGGVHTLAFAATKAADVVLVRQPADVARQARCTERPW